MAKKIVYPKMTDKTIPATATCQETSGMIHDEYIRCGEPAVAVVKTRDPNPYYMCLPHASHTIDHRGGELVLTNNPEMAHALNGGKRSLKDRMKAATAGTKVSMVPVPHVKQSEVPAAPEVKETIPDINELIGDEEDRSTLSVLIQRKMEIDEPLKPLEKQKDAIVERIKVYLSGYGITSMMCQGAKVSYTVIERKALNQMKLIESGVAVETIVACTDITKSSTLKITPAKD